MGKRSKKGGKGGGNRSNVRTNYSEVEKENKKYEQYYNTLQIVPDEEKEEFWAALRRVLPNSFRFTGSKSHALAVQKRLKDFYIPHITSITYEGNLVEPPRPVPWYPDQLAWSMTTPKNVVRRFAPFASFQKFLVSETETGNISRQEVVSMIPPLLLDVEPGSVVLDMCAAPGSKSAQLMEMVHAGEEERLQEISHLVENASEEARRKGDLNIPELLGQGTDSDGYADDGRSTGLLIANDSDYKRAHMLIHQMKRLNSPNLIVTNHDAGMYPSIKLPPVPGPDGQAQRNRYLKFDRILADVPCSGDGTARKNVNVWKDWSPANGIGLHATQSRILARALQMLKVGGRVVYSTCSMNPIENEAIVANVIGRCGGSEKVEIVDCSDRLPGLKRSPGLKNWVVMDKQGGLWDNYSNVEAAITGGNTALEKIVESMFPPTEQDEGLDLSRCMRVYPHQQDTGGFFITVLEKKGEIKLKPENAKRVQKRALDGANGESASKRPKTADDTSTESPAAEATEQPQPDPPESKTTEEKPSVDPIREKPKEPATTTAPQKRRPGQPFEEPYKYLNPQLEELNMIYDYYDISQQFPRDRFMVRNAEGRPSKTIYYTSALSRDILVENEGSGIKFVHSGVKMFVKQDVQRGGTCPWRIQTDGLSILESWIGKRRVAKLYKKEPLRILLVEMFTKMSDGGWQRLDEISEWARDISPGCCVLRVEASDAEDGFSERMVLPLWRSLYSLNLMLPKEDRRAMLLRLFDDDTPLVNITQKGEEAAAAINGGNSADADAKVEEKEERSPTPKEEEDAIKQENLILGQEEQEAMNARETYVAAGEEQDVMNTTV